MKRRPAIAVVHTHPCKSSTIGAHKGRDSRVQERVPDVQITVTPTILQNDEVCPSQSAWHQGETSTGSFQKTGFYNVVFASYSLAFRGTRPMPPISYMARAALGGTHLAWSIKHSHFFASPGNLSTQRGPASEYMEVRSVVISCQAESAELPAKLCRVHCWAVQVNTTPLSSPLRLMATITDQHCVAVCFHRFPWESSKLGR